MKDERISKEHNNAKGVVLFIIFFCTLAVFFIKLALSSFTLWVYPVELYTLVLSGLSIALKHLYLKDRDERIEFNYEKMVNVIFFLLVFGGFFIHFYNVSHMLGSASISLNFTSTLTLIGVIVYLVQCKKRGVYANHKWIDLPKKEYLSKVFKSLGIIGLIFFIYTIPFFIENTQVIIGLLAVLFTYVSLSISYLFLALYEKNNFDEETLFLEGRRRILTKNARLLFIIPFIYGFANRIVNAFYSFNLVLNQSAVNTEYLEVLTFFFQLYNLDILIIMTAMYCVIYFYIKKFNAPKILLTILKIYIITYIVFGFSNYIYNLSIPLVFSLLNDVDQIIQIFNTVGTIFTVIGFINTSLIIAMIIILVRKTSVNVLYLLIYIVPGLLQLFLNLVLNIFSHTVLYIVISVSFTIISSVALFLFLKQQERIISIPDAVIEI